MKKIIKLLIATIILSFLFVAIYKYILPQFAENAIRILTK